MTPIWDAMIGTGPDRAERMAKMVEDTPLRRSGTVEEVAALVVFWRRTRRRTSPGPNLTSMAGC